MKVDCSKCLWSRKRSYEKNYDNAFCVSFDRCAEKNKNNNCIEYQSNCLEGKSKIKEAE